jgi:hypothetical protein
MRILLIILIFCACSKKFVPNKHDEMGTLYVLGLKSIRHDAILRLKFHKSHEINKEIKKLSKLSK